MGGPPPLIFVASSEPRDECVTFTKTCTLAAKARVNVTTFDLPNKSRTEVSKLFFTTEITTE